MPTYFSREYDLFSDENKMMVIGQREAVKIINKLCRHFKLPKVNVTFDKRRPNCGQYNYPTNQSKNQAKYCTCNIDLHKEVFSIGTITHEVGHHMDFIKNGSPKNRKWHTKKLLVMVKRINRYCKKKEYWGWIKE